MTDAHSTQANAQREYDVRRGNAAVTGRFCVIGSKLNEQALKELFEVE